MSNRRPSTSSRPRMMRTSPKSSVFSLTSTRKSSLSPSSMLRSWPFTQRFLVASSTSDDLERLALLGRSAPAQRLRGLGVLGHQRPGLLRIQRLAIPEQDDVVRSAEVLEVAARLRRQLHVRLGNVNLVELDGSPPRGAVGLGPDGQRRHQLVVGEEREVLRLGARLERPEGARPRPERVQLQRAGFGVGLEVVERDAVVARLGQQMDLTVLPVVGEPEEAVLPLELSLPLGLPEGPARLCVQRPASRRSCAARW